MDVEEDRRDRRAALFSPSPLLAAVEAGDFARVQALVAAGADVDQLDYRQRPFRTPLCLAVKNGHVVVARYLIESGANKDATCDRQSYTSLHVAAREGNMEMVRMLTETGANKDSTDFYGLTPIEHAICEGHVAVVEHLLEQGCDVNRQKAIPPHGGFTLLHWAAAFNRLEIAQLLFRYGATLDIKDNQGRTPAEVAIANGHPAFADAIRAEEIRRRDHGFKRDRSTIPGTEEHEASKRPRAEREAAEAAAAAADAAADESDEDDDDDDDEEEEGDG